MGHHRRASDAAACGAGVELAELLTHRPWSCIEHAKFFTTLREASSWMPTTDCLAAKLDLAAVAAV
jgi:hypothetical protein